MKTASLEQRRLFALRYHAAHAFSTVVDICKHILDTPIETDAPVYNFLIVAIYTTYGRPFTNSRGFGKLDTDLIPSDQKALHDDLIQLRDKLYSHADKDLIHEDYGPANDIRVTIPPDGECRLWIQPFQATPFRLKAILSLASQMHKKMEYWTDRFVRKYLMTITDIEFPAGEYLLDTETDKGLLKKRNAEQANRESHSIRRAIWRTLKSKAKH